jgi:hypothetical protein
MKKIFNLYMVAATALSATYCAKTSSPEAEGSLTLAVPKLPSEFTAVKKWTFELYCADKGDETQIRTGANLVGSVNTDSNGSIVFKGEKIKTVKEGWLCLIDMSTEESVASAAEVKPAASAANRKLYFSSAPTKVSANRLFKAPLKKRYRSSDATPVVFTVTRTGNSAGRDNNATLAAAGAYAGGEINCSGLGIATSDTKNADAASVTLTFKLSKKERDDKTCYVELRYKSKTFKSGAVTVGTQDKIAIEAKEVAGTPAAAADTIVIEATIEE